MEEAEEARSRLYRLLDHDGDAQRHERLAEVDHSFALRRDCHRCNCNVSLASHQLAHDAVPASSGVWVLHAVFAILHDSYFVLTRDGRGKAKQIKYSIIYAAIGALLGW